MPGSGGLLMGKFSGGSEPPGSASVGSWSSGQTPGLAWAEPLVLAWAEPLLL